MSSLSQLQLSIYFFIILTQTNRTSCQLNFKFVATIKSIHLAQAKVTCYKRPFSDEKLVLLNISCLSLHKLTFSLRDVSHALEFSTSYNFITIAHVFIKVHFLRRHETKAFLFVQTLSFPVRRAHIGSHFHFQLIYLIKMFHQVKVIHIAS